MNPLRRTFLRTTLGACALATAGRRAVADSPREVTDAQLARVAEAPVLNVEELTSPVKIASMELLRNGRNFLVRVRTTGGDEGLGVPNAMHLIDIYPIFVNRVAPFFVGKDARQLEPLALGALPARRQLQVPGAGLLGLRGGRRVRDPRPARQAGRASRSATCSAASSGARSPSTAPAATGATPPRRRSSTSSSSSPRPAPRRSSSASAAG